MTSVNADLALKRFCLTGLANPLQYVD